MVNKIKILYIVTVENSPLHLDKIKIGETFATTELSASELARDDNEHVRCNAVYTRYKTSPQAALALSYKLKILYTCVAYRPKLDSSGQPTLETEVISDDMVKANLKKHGIEHVVFDHSGADEWYEIPLARGIEAIYAVKNHEGEIAGHTQPCLPGLDDFDKRVNAEIKAERKRARYASGRLTWGEPFPDDGFRAEQWDFIHKTRNLLFEDTKEPVLWNAKMRFGKTLATLRLIKEMGFRRTILCTHRPVVGGGWQEDFYKIFTHADGYEFVFKSTLQTDDGTGNDDTTDRANDARLAELIKNKTPFIYFASLQDLRGSKLVIDEMNQIAARRAQKEGRTYKPSAVTGYNKNKKVFGCDWDCVVIDEAHEGTQTDLGAAVVKCLKGSCAAEIDLSGTPFNIAHLFSPKRTLKWDYIDEQERKQELIAKGFTTRETNPYLELPRLEFYSYRMTDLIPASARAFYLNGREDCAAFSFDEFFRVWKNVEKDPLPAHFDKDTKRVKGHFVYEREVDQFIAALSTPNDATHYPFASREFSKDKLKYTFWILPGVAAAKALKDRLLKNAFFRENFNILNAAGNEEIGGGRDAIESVKAAIKVSKAQGKGLITLSCGKLTTGVTVHEWTGVLYLAGSVETLASAYLQTVFRVQSTAPRGEPIKETGYVFDFAPDRVLQVCKTMAEDRLRNRPKKESDREQELRHILNFIPVHSVTSGRLERLDERVILTGLARIMAERAVMSGFSDRSIYDSGILAALTERDMSALEELSKKVTAMSGNPSKNGKTTAKGGLDAPLKTGGEADSKKHDMDDPEAEARRREAEEKRRKIRRALEILGDISIRLPLMIYGANTVGGARVDADALINLEEFINSVDTASWKVFLPAITKSEFKSNWMRFYDQDVFMRAAQRYRQWIAKADDPVGNCTVTKRVKTVIDIFETFRNPAKETVLTPFNVVNRHLARVFAAWTLYPDDAFTRTDTAELLDTPRLTTAVEVAAEASPLVREGARILEINSKSGLYPLLIAYSRYTAYLRAHNLDEKTCSYNVQLAIWDEILKESVFILCQSPMAKAITHRTLAGFREGVKTNLRVLTDLHNRPLETLVKEIKKGRFWGLTMMKELEFDAVVGNPPYQRELEGSTKKKAVYHKFIDLANALSSKASLITPARFLSNAGDTPHEWMKMILSDEHFKVIWHEPKSLDVFSNVDIKGGIAVTYRDAQKTLGPVGCHTSNALLTEVLKKVQQDENGITGLNTIVYPQSSYTFSPVALKKYPEIIVAQKGVKHLVSSVLERFPELFTETPSQEDDARIHGRVDDERVYRYVRREYLKTPANFESWKVFVPKANGTGAIGEILSTPVIGAPVIGHTETFISLGSFKSEAEARALLKYICTRFARAMLGTKKVTQDNKKKVWVNVPLQDFTSSSDIDWTQSVDAIDAQLFAKYSLTPAEIAFIQTSIRPMNP